MILPIWFAPASVNQMLPSGPSTIPYGWAPGVGTGNSVISSVSVLIMPILFVLSSVNQTVPSGPAVIPSTCGLAVVEQRELGDLTGGRVDGAELVGRFLEEPVVGNGMPAHARQGHQIVKAREGAREGRQFPGGDVVPVDLVVTRSRPGKPGTGCPPRRARARRG